MWNVYKWDAGKNQKHKSKKIWDKDKSLGQAKAVHIGEEK